MLEATQALIQATSCQTNGSLVLRDKTGFDDAEFRSVNVRCETLGIQGGGVIGCDRSVSESAVAPQSFAQNDGLCHYVADMQLHMALQARFMLPNLNSDANGAAALVHQAQADAEKFASRQWR